MLLESSVAWAYNILKLSRNKLPACGPKHVHLSTSWIIVTFLFSVFFRTSRWRRRCNVCGTAAVYRLLQRPKAILCDCSAICSYSSLIHLDWTDICGWLQRTATGSIASLCAAGMHMHHSRSVFIDRQPGGLDKKHSISYRLSWRRRRRHAVAAYIKAAAAEAAGGPMLLIVSPSSTTSHCKLYVDIGRFHTIYESLFVTDGIQHNSANIGYTGSNRRKYFQQNNTIYDWQMACVTRNIANFAF